jgi:hypothetical protein
MFPTTPGPAADTQAEQDELEKLAAEVSALGFTAQLVTPAGRLPHLEVSNPRNSRLTERVYAQAGSYFWPWAEPIAACGEPAGAASIIARVLRTIDSDQ